MVEINCEVLMYKLCCPKCGRTFNVYTNAKSVSCVCGATGKNPYYVSPNKKKNIIFWKVEIGK
jgi:hypothetical protein